MADIIPIAAHLSEPDPEIVEYMRTLLSEAQNGRVTGFVMLYIDGDGGMHSSYLLNTTVMQMACARFVNFDAINEHTD